HPLCFPANGAGYVDTGWICRLDAGGLVVAAPPPGLTLIGGYPFHLNQVDEFVAEIDPDATIVALPDADLSQRFPGTAVGLTPLRREMPCRVASPPVLA